MKPKIIVTTTGKPPLSGAEALARLLLQAQEKRPELKVVAKSEKAKTA